MGEVNPPESPVPALSVPEIRDYSRINAELIALLNVGHPRVRLVGVDRQRLLLFGLRGAWRAVVEVEGHAGPELAAELDAPDLIVACTGSVGDGAGRSLRAGRLWIAGHAGASLGYNLEGGTIALGGNAGTRLGLQMRAGLILVGGSVGRLAGERQTGGRILIAGEIGHNPGLGAQGGRMVTLDRASDADREVIAEEARLAGDLWPGSFPFSRQLP